MKMIMMTMLYNDNGYDLTSNGRDTASDIIHEKIWYIIIIWVFIIIIMIIVILK